MKRFIDQEAREKAEEIMIKVCYLVCEYVQGSIHGGGHGSASPPKVQCLFGLSSPKMKTSDESPFFCRGWTTGTCHVTIDETTFIPNHSAFHLQLLLLIVMKRS